METYGQAPAHGQQEADVRVHSHAVHNRENPGTAHISVSGRRTKNRWSDHSAEPDPAVSHKLQRRAKIEKELSKIFRQKSNSRFVTFRNANRYSVTVEEGK